MEKKLTEGDISMIAHIAHETNKAYCKTMGDDSQPPWETCPDWQRESAIAGVKYHLKNPGALASDSHNNWYVHEYADGWSYGPVKDPENKRHPCMIPFAELSLEQQIKDHVFRSVVHGVAAFMQEPGEG